MKIIYFVVNGRVSSEDKALRENMLKGVNKVLFSNGSVSYGFEDSCDAVYLSADFPHIEKWAISKGIQILKPEPVKEVTPDAETHPKRTQEEAQADEEVADKPKPRGRRPKSSNPSE